MNTRTFLKIILSTFCFAQIAFSQNSLLSQYHYATGVYHFKYVEGEQGQTTSPVEVISPGSCFDLWTQGFGDDYHWYHLDTKVVGTYLPSASVEIISQDPSPNLRTRIDIPFTVNYDYGVNTVYPSHLVPLDASGISSLFVRSGERYPDGLYRTTLEGTVPRYEIASYDVTSGSGSSQVLSEVFTDGEIGAGGEEIFSIYSYSTDEVPTESILDSESIQVWPIAVASFSGLTPNATYTHTLPDLLIDLKDLYPDSLTYLQLYEGKESLGKQGHIFPATVREHNTIVPQNETIVLNEWDTVISKDGIYTLEILTVTPFFGGVPERLAHITFEVDKEVELRATLTNSE